MLRVKVKLHLYAGEPEQQKSPPEAGYSSLANLARKPALDFLNVAVKFGKLRLGFEAKHLVHDLAHEVCVDISKVGLREIRHSE